MNILHRIKAIFIKPQPTTEQQVAKLQERYGYEQNDAETEYPTTEQQVAKLQGQYSDVLTSLLYSPETDVFLRQELLPFLDAPEPYNGYLEHDHWKQKHPFNFPGPFYTGESDSCGTGIVAPHNVMFGEYCSEYISKQPTSWHELVCVLEAAAIEVFDSYSCNGNKHWTYELCKEWWAKKYEIVTYLCTPEAKKEYGDHAKRYIHYLNTEAETDLRRYCFFLLYGYYPAPTATDLPPL